MDLISGLQAASTAIGIAKDLREIDRGVDEASFKLKLAELNIALADTKTSLAEAKEVVSSLERRLEEAENGEVCPKCRTGRMQLIETRNHTQQGLHLYGVEVWKFQCDNDHCEFDQKRLHDPHGAIPKTAGKGR